MDRGRYLTENLLNCFACHSERDWAQHDAPVKAGTHGAGSPTFPLLDLPGEVHPPNITPDKETGAGNWTDDQLARAIREGIGYDGRALFPFMPYENFRYLSDEDLASVIVYLRSLAPVRQAVPKDRAHLSREVPDSQRAASDRRGSAGARYVHAGEAGRLPGDDRRLPRLSYAAAHGQRMMELDLAGGFFLRGPWGEVASANITPAPSGIPYYDERLFMDAIRTGWVKARKLSQIMPWFVYRGLTDDDLKSMFAYVRAVPAVAHRVDNSKPPTPCKLCGFSHGAGDQN